MNKSTQIILIIALAGLILYLLFSKPKSKKRYIMSNSKLYQIIPSKNGQEPFEPANEHSIRKALQYIKEKYGDKIARLVEQMFRLETANFTSTAFKLTNGAGVVTSLKNDLFPHRNKLKVYYKPLYKNGKLVKNVFTTPDDPQGKPIVYVIFPTIKDGMLYLANYIKKYGDNAPERWSGGAYNIQKLQKIKTLYV